MKAEENHAPRKRGIYRRSTDDDIYFFTGKFPLITTLELSDRSGRNPISLRKRLRQLCLVNHLGRVEGGEQREEFFRSIACQHCGTQNKIPISDGKIRPKPFFYYLKPKGGDKARPLLENPVIWKTDPKLRDHDRVINTIHLSLDDAFGKRLTEWCQQRDDVVETIEVDDVLREKLARAGFPKRIYAKKNISFYTDGRFFLDDPLLYLEYANSEPHSEDGVNDNVKKVILYNEIMKDSNDDKVLFVFRERSMVENFVRRLADEYPYHWIYVTDVESITQNPKGKIFWTPYDFDERRHTLTDTSTSTEKEIDRENVRASR